MTILRLFFLGCTLIFSIGPAIADNKDYFDMSLEELMNVQVTSASKKPQQLSDVAAAVFVISHEDIKRSGATSIPEALRMAPGLEVSRIDASKWAVSARGFNGRFANKLLVLIDGRSVYTLAFSGVYWENQDLMMEDIDHIEVIRGPGAALWGANAVNGVINIITKHSSDTRGGLLTAGGGSKEQGFGSARYGAQLGEDTTGRVYFKGFNRGDFKLQDNRYAHDNFNNLQGGFRIDSTFTPKDSLTVSADAFTSEIRENLSFASLTSPPTYRRDIIDTTQVSGGNLRSNYRHTLSPDSNYTVQFYYDIYKRLQPFDDETRQTVDIEFQHNFKFNPWNEIVWGASYRYMDGDHQFPMPDIFSLTTPNPKNHYFSLFAKDEIALLDEKLWLTLGSKFEHNDFTGFEIQPTARLLWAPNDQHRFWGAISRAVRTPSIIDDSLSLIGQFIPQPKTPINPSGFPLAPVITGSRNFKAEELLAFELGYRFTLANKASLDLTTFYNDFNSLRTSTPGAIQPTGVLPFFFTNQGSGKSYGFEASAVWQMTDWWRLEGNYSFFNSEINQGQGNQPLISVSPSHKVSVRTGITPVETVNLDFWLRYNSDIKALSARALGTVPVKEYVTLDARLGWQIHPSLELSVTGQNLLDSRHLEFIEETYILPTEIPRGVYGKIKIEF